MLGLVGYSILSLFIGIGMTVLVHLFRPIRTNDAFPALKYILGFTAAAMAVPYLGAEALTKVVGPSIVKPTMAAAGEAGVEGELLYHKVTWFDGTIAKVIVVVREPNRWGNEESTVLEVGLAKEPGRWEVTDCRIVNSFQRQDDATTFPPYW